MLRMFRGDKTFLPENLGPPSHIVVSCSYLFCFAYVMYRIFRVYQKR